MTVRTRLALVSCVFCLLLSACGFGPLYGGHGAATTGGLDTVFVGNIPDREGQYLRNALIDRFYRHGMPGDPLYELHVSRVTERRTDLDITRSSDATRAQLRLDVDMVLIERATGKELLRRPISAITSYNVLQSQFTTRVSADNARLNALDDIARQIETRLALYFHGAP